MENTTDFVRLMYELECCTSLQELTEIGCRLIGNPMFYQDMEHNIVAHTKSVEVHHPDWERVIMKGILTMGMIDQDRVVVKYGKKFIENGQPILTASPDGGYQIIVQPIFIDKIQYGVLVVGGHFGPFKEGDIELVKLVAAVLTSKVQYHKHFISPEKSLNETIIIKLLNGEVLSEKFVNDRLKRLKWKPRKYLYVMTIWGREIDNLKNDRLGEIVRKLNTYSAHKLTIYNNSLVYIFSSDEDRIDWQKQDSELLRFLAGENLSIGVSRSFSVIGDLKTYYQQSLKALSMGSLLKRDGSIFEYDDMSIYHLMELCREKVELESFVCADIRFLAEYDLLHGGNLIITLRTYLECGQDIVRTANELFIHKNTVRYRIAKCRELLESELKDGNECFNLLMSLKLLEYTEKG